MATVSFNTYAYAFTNQTKWVENKTWGYGNFYVGNTGAGCVIGISVSGTSDTISSLTLKLPMTSTQTETCNLNAYLYTDPTGLKPDNYWEIPSGYVASTTVSQQKLTASASTVTFTFSNLSITGKLYLYVKLNTAGSYLKSVYTGSSYGSSISCTTSSSGGGTTTTTYYASIYDLTNSTYLSAETSYTTSSITAPSLTGYTYVGYKRGSSQSNAFNQSSYYSTSNTTSLTTTNNHCIFYYQENSSSGGGGSGETTTYYTITCKDRIYSSSGTLLNTYSKGSKSYAKGSTAKGSDWGTTSSYTGYYYDGCTAESSVSANGTVYRDFSPNSYSVKYNLNGATGTTPTNTTRYYNETYILTSITPTRSGYIFVGWNTISSETSGFTSGSTIPASTSTSTIIYYAIWKKLNNIYYCPVGKDNWISSKTYKGVKVNGVLQWVPIQMKFGDNNIWN